MKNQLDAETIMNLIKLKRENPKEYKKLMEDMLDVMLDFAVMLSKVEDKLEKLMDD